MAGDMHNHLVVLPLIELILRVSMSFVPSTALEGNG